MRRPRIVLALLLGAGLFLIGLGLLARYYVFPNVAVLPIDRYEKTESRAVGATYVDRSTGVQHTGRDLIAVNVMRGDVDASTPDIAVWDSLTWTRDAASGDDVNFYNTTVAMERHTARAVNCCGHHIEGVGYLPRSGLAYQWPFYTERTSYPFYDEVLRRTYPMRFERTDELFGLDVYRFTQRIEPTKLEDVEVPASIVGRPGTGTVDAERWYGVERTYWVEPRSGVVVKAGNHRRETLRVDGVDALTVFDANVVLGDRDVRRIVAEARDARVKIGLLHDTAYWGALGLGALLIVFAGLVALAREPEPAAAPAPLELAPVP